MIHENVASCYHYLHIMISIVIPTFKEDKYIRDCILQFRALKIPHEIIVSDDGSKDTTVEIARGLGVRVLTTEKKYATIAMNRNAGAKVATGDYLAFFDADSRVMDVNSFFRLALADFVNIPNLCAVTGSFWVIPTIASITDRFIYTIFNVVHRIKNNVIHTGEAPGKFQMIRRDAFLRIGGFREDLVSREDADIFQRLNRIGRTFADKNLLVYHSGRRSKALGWPKLLWIWMRDAFLVAIRGKSGSTEWVAHR